MVVHQSDVSNAFLNALLTEEIYMDPPTGLEIPVGKTLLLLKSIYGLRQAPREWNKLLHGWLMESEFVQSTEDPCLYLLF